MPNRKPRRKPRRITLPRDYKARGEWVELLFMTEAARRGLKVAKPYGDSSRTDVIVESLSSLARVQVKSTANRAPGCEASYLCPYSWGTRSRNPRGYSPNDFDFLAVYIIPEDAWFIIPSREVRTTALCLSTNKPGPYDRFREAWHLLGKGDLHTIWAQTEELPIAAAAPPFRPPLARCGIFSRSTPHLGGAPLEGSRPASTTFAVPPAPNLDLPLSEQDEGPF